MNFKYLDSRNTIVYRDIDGFRESYSIDSDEIKEFLLNGGVIDAADIPQQQESPIS